jgi:glucoamylase
MKSADEMPVAAWLKSRLGAVFVAAVILVLSVPAESPASGIASDGPGDHASWTTGNKLAVGTSADAVSKVWFTVARGITTEVFYPRLDVPNMQDMQYIITDGLSFVDLERDATSHVVSMPDEKAMEYTITNTDKRPSPKYRITSTYITDASRSTLLIQTHFQSLDGGRYQLYLLENASTAGGGANNNARWDAANSALLSSGTVTLAGSSILNVSALKVAAPNGFIAHDNGYSGQPSDCYRDLSAHKTLINQFDSVASNGNVVQCGQIGGIGADTTFTVALGFGSDAVSAAAAASQSLAVGFGNRETAYRSGWESYVNGLRGAPASVASDTDRRRAYYVAAMALHAAEDKTFRGASVAGFATPWGDFVNGDNLNEGYHRVWGRDLYEQATGLLAAGDLAQPLRMAQFMWNSQYLSTNTPGANTTYLAGSFPRFSPVSGNAGAGPELLGCCEQLDQASFAIVLAWMTGLTDNVTYQKIKTAANHIETTGPATFERWEEQPGRSPSSTAAEIAGLVAAADIARQNGDAASASIWESTADAWRTSLPGLTFTTSGFWGAGHYYERIDQTSNPNDSSQICFDEGCFRAHDIVDFGFLELVRLGIQLPNEANISTSLSPTAIAFDGNSSVQVTMLNGDVYFHRYEHDNYGESNDTCNGWQNDRSQRMNNYGRFWPVLSGERGEYEIANGRPAAVYLQSLAHAANDGYFVPEQVWDRANISCFVIGRPTGSAAPLNWAEGQYLRLAQSIDAGYALDTPSVIRAKYRGAGAIFGEGGECVDDALAGTANGTAIQLFTCNGSAAQNWTWNSADGSLRALGKCMDASGGGTADGTLIQLFDCNGSGAQQWRWRNQNRLVNPQSGRCLDATVGAQGTQLRIRDCNGGASQEWYLK